MKNNDRNETSELGKTLDNVHQMDNDSDDGNQLNTNRLSRRRMLQVLGAGGILLAGQTLIPKLSFAEAAAKENKDEGGTQGSMLQTSNLKALLDLPPGQQKAGTIVYVAGYNTPGDGGGKFVYWAASSTKADNGGTVHQPAKGNGQSGRWEVIHQGVGDFRWFGIFGPERNADDALDAMVNDSVIHRIEAHTDLNFVRRHRFNRSNIELDFGGHMMTTEGIELNTLDNPFGAVLFFQGVPTGATITSNLTKEIAEGSDILEVPSSAAFQIEDWWVVQLSNNPGGKAQRELDYLLKVTEIIDGTHIRVNYKAGWPIAAGRTLTFKKMNPVFRAHVRNMRFTGVPVPPSTSTSVRPFETWDQIGSNPVAYEFAVECDVSGIRATKVFWPVIQRRYCSHYVTASCELINPEERDWGGTGYMTQQLNVLYGHVKDCNTSNARHLNDFTCAAYCMVENCHGDGDDYGPFVTHGQYEHDLVYIGNSGLMSFANSGTNWGDSAKRITVKKHIATRIVAHKKLTDLTLEDCHAVVKEGLANSGSIWANVDGLQMRGCTGAQMITLSQSSALSKRRNVLDSCSFGMVSGYEIARPIRSDAVGNLPVQGNLHITNCEFHNVEDVNIGSINKLTLTNCRFYGTSPATGRVRVGSKHITITGGEFSDCGFVLTGAWDKTKTGIADQSVTVGGGAEFSGSTGERAFIKSVDPSNAVTLSYGSCTSAAADGSMAHFQLEGGSYRLQAVGARFQGGKYIAAENGLQGDGYFFITGCIEQGVDRSSLPAENETTIKHSAGNMQI
ncbi:hypothetical protein [Paenibacillus sp. GCM10027626]|uniref:hypothetical protein n=1 Tax=Paenibacillus sp. GCM10027626 TaxID=3273411 RepID=UPI0036314CA0